MTDTEKPLHVRVAEALGTTCVWGSNDWRGMNDPDETWMVSHQSEGAAAAVLTIPVPRYDTDWSATGPLIEKYKIGVAYIDSTAGRGWVAKP